MKRILSAVVLSIALSLSTVSAGAEDNPGADIPVLGTFTYPHFGKASGQPIIGAVHGVRRVDGATAVYYSVATSGTSGAALSSSKAFEPRSTPYKIGQAAAVEISDPVALKGYRPLTVDGSGGLVSNVSALKAAPGEFVSIYALLPELPAETTEVDLQFEWGVSVTGVPVADGALLPDVPAEFVPLGEGWPALPDGNLISQAQAATSTFDLMSRTGDLEQASERSETPSEVSVTLAADFFFEPGEWGLSPKGVTKVESIAAELDERGAKSVSVTGYTDSVPDSNIGNQKLSERRAKTVSDLIKAEVPGVKAKVEGKGEADAVGSNSTDEGRAQNRRVTVDYEVDQ